MVQKFYAIDNEDSIKKGTIISTIFALVVSGGCYFLGGFGRLFSDKIDIAANGYDSIIPTMLENLHPLLIGCYPCFICLNVYLIFTGHCFKFYADH
jgi:SSS family solute:Na+ symporter